jgi:hypothetical protein
MNARKMLLICHEELEPYLAMHPEVYRIGMDGWPGHNSTKARLREIGEHVWDWPANSCDFNPIENVFSAIKAYWSKRCPMDRTPTKAEVIAGHQEAWEAYDMDDYEKIIAEMPLRMAACIRAGGWRFSRELRDIKKERKAAAKN